MATKLRLGIDLDGVCADWYATIRRLSLEMFNKPDPPDAPKLEWDFKDWLTPQEHRLVMQRFDSIKNGWTTLGKLKETHLLKNAQYDYQIYFLTSRRPTSGHSVETQTCRWLTMNYDISYPQVIVGERKGEVANALELFAFIDDKPEYCVNVVHKAATCKHTTYLCNGSDNSNFSSLAYGIIRVPDLNTFLEAMP